MEVTSNELTNYVDLVGYDEKYQISTEYPYFVMNKQTNNIIKESINNSGHVQINIDGKCFTKHRIIAMQFIKNDDPLNKNEIDHINSNKLDNNIINLQWITHSEYLRKRRTFKKQLSEFLDDTNLLKYARIVEYNGEKFDRYYYDRENNRLLLRTKSKRVKVVKPMKRGNNYESVAVTTERGVKMDLIRRSTLHGYFPQQSGNYTNNREYNDLQQQYHSLNATSNMNQATLQSINKANKQLEEKLKEEHQQINDAQTKRNKLQEQLDKNKADLLEGNRVEKETIKLQTDINHIHERLNETQSNNNIMQLKNYQASYVEQYNKA